MKRTKKLFALIMSCAMLMSLLPTTALAEEDAAEETAETTAEETEIQAADLEIAEDGTATIVIGDAEEAEEDEALAGLPDEAVPDDAAEAEDADAAEEAEEAEPEEVIYTAAKDAVSVKVTAPYGALPEGAELSVKRYAKDSDEYGDAAKAIGFEENAGTDMAAFDISFLVQGEEVEPAAPVKVSIDVSDILPDSADAGSLEVQHLVETPDDDIEAVVVANESGATEGKIDEANATAEFEVESFSTFTVTWDESVTTEGAETITVHVYNINGTSIDEELDEYETYYSTGGVITISDLITHLHQNAEYDSIYTFQYATVFYEFAQENGASYDPYTIGGEGDSVTSISKSADGETYTVIHGDSDTAETVEDPYIITIHLYYSLPTVTLNTEDAQGETVEFTTTPEYFQGDTDEADYHWALTDENLGTITPDENGGATFTWDTDVAQVGDQVTVEVTMTVTYTDAEGEEQTEKASATYTLTYGTEAVTITVTDADGNTVSGARVALCTGEDGSYTTVTTGVTGEDGTVVLYAEPGEYTVGVTYAEVTSTAGGGSTSRYSGEGTVTVNDEGTGAATVALGEAIVSGPPDGDTNGSYAGGEAPYYYEHIDVKIAVAGTEDASATFNDLDAVYVYDKYGNLIYWSDDLIENEGTTDYNCAFDMNGAEDIHSIVVSSEDSIVLVYEVIEDGEYKTYTIRVNADSYYPEGEYYSYTDVNAWQLCNSIYGTEITQAEWNVAVEEGEDAVAALFEEALEALGEQYNANGISISGLSYIQVADYLCDTRTTGGQAGLDIAIDVGAMSVLAQEYDLQIAKSLQNVPENFSADSLEVFNFNLTELVSVTAGDVGEEVWSTEEDNVAGTPLTGSTSEWTNEGDGSWSSIINFQDFISYEAEENTEFYYYILSEDEAETATADVQYYGIEVAVTFSSTTGTASVVVSYCELTQEDEDTYIRTSIWSGLTAQTGYDYDEEGNVTDTYTYYSVPFINTYDAYIDISGTKTWLYDSEEDRPESITVHLFADGEEVDSVEVTSDDNWEWKFENLPQYQTDGVTEIEYTILEGAIEDSNYIPTYDYATDEDGNFTGVVAITNAIPTVEKDVSDPAYGESTDDNLHQDGADNNDTLEYKMEADHIGGAHDLVLHDFLDDQLDIDTLAIQSVTLYADESDEGKVLEEGTDYTVSTGECSAECGLDGCSFEIHIIDEDVEDLTSDAFVIVIFDIEVHEGVENFDENDVDEIDNFVGLSFTVNDVSTYAEPDETETYSYGFDLYKYDADTGEALAGVEFVMSNSDGRYAQFDVTDETYLLTGWADSEDDATPIVTGSDGKAVVEGLHDGTFSIEETKAPEGYQQKVGTMTVTITVDEDDPDNPTITATNADVDGLEVQIDNTPGEDLIEIIGSKTWVDGDDEDGIRPDSITIHLLADGEEADSVTVTADDNWAWSFKDMPKYQDDGTTEIVYTITEDEVDDYDTMVDGLNVTNTHEPEPQNPVKSVDTDGDGDFDNDGDEVEYLDTLTYKIEYYNHNTTAATVTITDELDDALDFVSASDGGVYDEDTRTITWTIENAAPTSWGSVTFTAEVNEEGLEGIVIENTASVQIGNDAAVDTNTVENPTEEGELTESPVPKTGDTSHPISWMLMLLASIMAIGAALALRKQNRR